MLQSRISAALITAALSLTAQALAQDQPQPSFNRTQCIKAQPGKMAELQKFALDEGHKGAMARANAGEYASALFLRSVYGGTETACDFVAVTIYNGPPPDPESTMDLETALQKAGIDMAPEEYQERLMSMGKLVSTSLWRMVDGFGHAEKGDYIRVDFMKPRPGQAAEWIKLERETFKPVHQARAEQGLLRGWSVAMLAYPSGTSLPYSGATVNIAPSWKALFSADQGYPEAFKKTMPNANMEEISKKTSETREIVRTELYRVIDTVTPMEKATRTKR